MGVHRVGGGHRVVRRRTRSHQRHLGHQQADAAADGAVPRAGLGARARRRRRVGRAAVGVLLARPNATVTGMDIYSGYWGIDGNTPARFMKNSASRVPRTVPTHASATCATCRSATAHSTLSSAPTRSTISVGTATRQALHEVARVLKAHGEFLLLIVNTDWWTWLVSPPMAHHFRPDAARWRAQLDDAGFVVEEEGTRPVTLYWLARKK